MVFAFLPGSVWRNVLVARTLRSTTHICGRPASSSGESTRVAGWGIDIRGSWSMSSHRDLFASLGGRFGKAISLALAGLIVMSGQNLAYAGTDTSTPTTDATSTASAPSGEYIVTFASGTTDAQRQDALVAVDAVSASSVPALRMYSASLTDAAVTTLGANPDVTRVEADAVREAQATPSDPSYGSQWALPKIDWDAAFGTVTPAGSATVAVLDTGVEATADLTGNLVAGASMLDGVTGTGDPNGHGTAMASIVAAGTDNGTGIAGVGYQGVSVMPVKVLGADGNGQDSDIVRGVVYAADHGADVILMSFSNPGRSEALQSAADYAWSKGAVLVAATGNDGSTTSTFPAGLAKVVGVSGTTRDDSPWTGSNSGADTFLGAPGVDIASGSAAITGTSASAAIAAGAAALVKANDSSTSNGVVVGRLARNADAAGSVSDTGNGRVHLARALSDTSATSVVPQGVAGNGGPIVGPYPTAAAFNATLEGQSPKGSTPWTSNAVTGYSELDNIPLRVHLVNTNNSPVTQEIVVQFDHTQGGTTPAPQDPPGFPAPPGAPTPQAPGRAPPAGDKWSYTFSITIAGNTDSDVHFTGRLAAGAHGSTGNSLALGGTPSLGTLPINKPAARTGNPDLAVAKTGPATAEPGDTISYTLNYQNKIIANGTTATGVQLSDTLPTGVTYVPGS